MSVWRASHPAPGAVAARVADLELHVRERGDEAELRATVMAESRFVAEAARAIPKQPRITVVEAPASYGNLSALVPAAVEAFGESRVLVLARNASSASGWRSRGVRAAVWDTSPGNAATWADVITSVASVHEHHLWWRTNQDMLLRSALAGAEQVQLWHGSTGPIGKSVGLAAMAGVPGMWNFADLVSTSVGFAYVVCEPRDADRRRREFVAEHQIHDVDHRMVGPLRRCAPGRPGSSARVLIAPTFPESDRGAAALARRVAAYAAAVARTGRAGDVRLRLHPWTPDVVRHAAGGLALSSDEDLYETIEDFDVLLTDYSSLAADFLLLGRRVVLDTADLEAYRSERVVTVIEELMACCGVATSATDAIALALSDDDPHADLRREQADERLSAIGAEPGRRTLELLSQRLDSAPDR